jgi:hypothetical protein
MPDGITEYVGEIEKSMFLLTEWQRKACADYEWQEVNLREVGITIQLTTGKK